MTAPGRAVELQVRVSAPVNGRNLPVVLLSHGHGMSNNLSSLNGYGPLANYWAARGFVVIQPTHLSSATLRGVVDTNGPEGALFWRSRANNPINEFYFSEADGCLKGEQWNVFWYGLESFEEIRFAVDHCRARPASLKD